MNGLSGHPRIPDSARSDQVIAPNDQTQPLSSGLYVGWVRHRRTAQVNHGFRYRLFYCLIDVAELPRLFSGRRMWGLERWAPASFRRADYLGQNGELDGAVRDVVERATGTRPAGPIRMLTQLRYWGYCFNPVTFYYCFATDGASVEQVVAEITNTPWGERHRYVVPCGRTARFAKEFHVSPFQDMDLEYAWRFTVPDQQLGVHMVSTRGGIQTFDATLVLRRRPWTDATLRGVWFRFPHMTALAILAIHIQALRLWWKRAPFFSHPARQPVPAAA
jgi:DUF1365 family protein